MRDPETRVTARLLFGLVVVAVGILLLLDQFNLLEADEILGWWPALLLGWGLMRLTGLGLPRRTTPGLIWTFVGGYLLLRHLDIIPWGLSETWPLLLVLLGVVLVVRSMQTQRVHSTSDDPTSRISAFALMSGLDRKVVSQDFRGGEITAIMGGHEIDLRPARIVSNPAVIDLSVIWGGVDLKVPEDWKVTVEALPLMGGIEDRSKAPVGEPKGHLVLKGFVLMGGVEVKN